MLTSRWMSGMGRIHLDVYFVLIFLPWLAAMGQKTAAHSYPRPAPQISGQFLESDGLRRVTLRYKQNSSWQTFTGAVQSPCMLPAISNPAATKVLTLSAIPIGTPMTVFYVRHGEKGKPTKTPENLILGLRFDGVPRGLTVPKGVAIPCFKGGPASSTKRK